MQLHWHRRDLRAADNPALRAATDAGETVPVFVFDDRVLEHGSPPRVAYMLDALDALQTWYREHDSTFVLAHGDPVEVIPQLATDLEVDRVTWSRDYSGLARERDTAVRQALDDAGIDRHAVHGALHHEPGSITTNKGEHYSVYTYFWKKWRDRAKASPLEFPPADALVGADELEVLDDLAVLRKSLPTISELGFDEPEAELLPAGTAAARDRLTAFCESDIYRYEKRRDYPADRCTSRLSADLSWGTIGVREVYAATEDAMARAETTEEEDSVEEFQSQLAWREFYMHVLAARPDVIDRNYKEYDNDIEWRHDPEALEAWTDGETGYPIVDAGMRQLRAEAYMHNRVRMIVASFHTKDLQLDWREGYDWFRRKLVDHDTANDTGGWQWAASTGTDAQPYFRIFNPMTQGERYDPDAEYIKMYVPELQNVPADQIHRWHELGPTQRQQLAPEYPAPIVDHSEQREAAIEMFERARGE
jgi:deoxyribodipyrimidine photo-lyase